MKIVSPGARGIPNVEGGAEKSAEMIFPVIARRHDVTMLCLAEFTEATEYRGVNIIRLPSVRILGTDKLYMYMASIWHIARMRPDIVHCQGLNAAFFLMVYKIFAKRVTVRYGSADYLNGKWGPIGRTAFRFCEWQLRYADAVISVTDSLKNRLVDRNVTDKVVVIPNAIDPVHVDVTPEDLAPWGLEKDRFLLSVGRITWQKDFTTLITAFQKAKEQRPDMGKLVLVGGDDGSGELQKLQAIAGDDVVFTGRLPRDQIGALYGSCLMYVNSSRHEGLSNAILEAISHDAPLVVSDIDENSDLPLSAEQFFRVGNIEELTAKIVLAADGEIDRFRIDKSIFASWDDVARRTEALFEALLDQPRGSDLPAEA